MNDGWIGKGDGGGSRVRGRGGGRGRGRVRGDLTGVKPCKPAAKELEGVSDEKRSRSEVALLRATILTIFDQVVRPSRLV